jgi:hypothetical protein
VSITQKFAIVDPRKAVFVCPASGERPGPAVICQKRQWLIRRIRMGKREARRKQQQAN